MDAFSYTDIFDTKGIEYLIVIGFLLLIVPIWIWLNKPLRAHAPKTSGIRGISRELLNIPQGIYFEENHTYAFLEQSGLARVGIDDLLQHLTGGISIEALRKVGDRVKKGEVIAAIVQDGKQLEVASPVSGTLTSVNARQNLGKGGVDTYKEGWICKIEPENWTQETVSCKMGQEALDWSEKELDRMKAFFTNSFNEVRSADLPPVVMQAGGELQEGILSEMPESVWIKFQSEMLD